MPREGSSTKYDDNVFLNVPFDAAYLPIFRALVFAVHDCGFNSRCALEGSDGGQVRVDKIYGIMDESRFGIHDISRTALDKKNRLPRFNMPFELGVFLGAKRFGQGRHRRKSCLILDIEPYRYQKYCSDISGQDIGAHQNRADMAILAARNWLNAARPHPRGFIPGGRHIARRYDEFRGYLPGACKRIHASVRDVPFLDYRMLVVGWIEVNRW